MKSITESSEDEIIEFYTEKSQIREKQKNELGEVFTPVGLINELLDALPKSVWTNPDLKWLDPAAGLGQFSAIIYIRLMKSLEKKIPNLNSRKTHILKNMLFMVELNKKSVASLKDIFGSSANISEANFLDQSEKWKKDLGIETFDIVIGNPPFQSPKKSDYKGGAGKNILWDKFVISILSSDTLNSGGHLAFITPASWRRPESDLYELMTRKNKLLFLHIYGKSDGIQLFGIQSRFDLYIIEKQNSESEKHYKMDVLIDEKSLTYKSFPVSSWPFIPNYAFDSIRQIIVPLDKGIPVIFDSSYYYYNHPLSKKRSEKKSVPVVHGIVAEGLIIKYSDARNPEQIGVKKVLLNFNEKQYPYVDHEGKYGMSQLTFGVPILSKTQGEQIKTAILSPRFQEILEATKWGAFQTDYRMFKYFDPFFYRKFLKNNKTIRKSIKQKQNKKNKTRKIHEN
jgi:hypothetical protein